MKIKYNSSNRHFAAANELYGIVSNKKRVAKGYRHYSYLKIILCYLIAFLCLLVFSFLTINTYIHQFVYIGVLFTLFMATAQIFVFCINYNSFKKSKNKNGLIEINKHGVFDLCDGITVGLSWDKFELCYIGQYNIVIIGDAFFYIHFEYNEDFAKKVIEEIKKYKEDAIINTK